MYAKTGRPSIPPENLLRALLLQVLYSVQSERVLMEQLEWEVLAPQAPSSEISEFNDRLEFGRQIRANRLTLMAFEETPPDVVFR